jgi:hypothetical protein
MSTPTHTQGSWQASTVGTVTTTDGSPICTVFAEGNGFLCGNASKIRETAQANAYLIASAPDLLAALRCCVDELDWRRRDSREAVSGPCPILVSARAAIAKATGGTK